MAKVDTGKIWGVLKPILTGLTNLLLIGRNAGLWSKKGGDLGGGPNGPFHK